MKISELLKTTGLAVITIRDLDTVETASTLLATNNIGALPVRDEHGDLIGVISERDIVRCFAADGAKVHLRLVRDLMSSKVITCDPDGDVNQAMAVMSQRRIRHLPVVKDGQLLGMISSRDVMGAVIAETRLERDVLRDVAIISR